MAVKCTQFHYHDWVVRGPVVKGEWGSPLMLQWKVCTCVHVLLLHTMFVLEVRLWSMDVYGVTYTHFVLVMLYTVHHTASHCTPLCTAYFTLYCMSSRASHAMYVHHIWCYYEYHYHREHIHPPSSSIQW